MATGFVRQFGRVNITCKLISVTLPIKTKVRFSSHLNQGPLGHLSAQKTIWMRENLVVGISAGPLRISHKRAFPHHSVYVSLDSLS